MSPFRRFLFLTLFGLLAPALFSQVGVVETKVLRLERREPDFKFRFRSEYRFPGQRKFALALRGGSAKGLAHLGVLQGLDEENIPVDAIVGTSAGSLIGSLYASGFSADGIARIFRSQNFGLAFDDRQREPGVSLSEDELSHSAPFQLIFNDGKPDLIPGRTTSRKVRETLLPMLGRAAWLADGDFNKLRMPFRAVASDLTEGTGKVFSSGSLIDVVMASTCIPGVFAPVEIDGHQYVDGGPFENLPAQISRKEFPELVQVGVAIGRPWDPGKKSNLARLLDASLDLAMFQTELRSQASTDLLIRPKMSQAEEFDFFHQVDALVQEGRAALDENLPKLENQIYGPRADERAASTLKLEANGVPNAAAWFETFGQPAGVRYRDLYRVIRKAYRDLPISDAEVRLPASADGEAVLVLRPSHTITKLVLDLPDRWPSEIRPQIEKLFSEKFHLRPGEPFNEGALGLAIEGLLVEGILRKMPILDFRGTGFTNDGVLTLRIREPLITTIVCDDPDYQGKLDRLVKDLQGGRVKTDKAGEVFQRTAARLGLDDLTPDLRSLDDDALAVALKPVKAPDVVITPDFAYEDSFGPHVALDAVFNNFLRRGSWIQLHGAFDNLQTQLQGQALDVFGAFPNIEFGLGGMTSKRWLNDSISSPIRKTEQEKFWWRTQARMGYQDRGLLQLDLGRSLGRAYDGVSSPPTNRADFVRMAFEWDTYDAHTLPTEGTLIRASEIRAFRADAGPAYSTSYLRIRHLIPGSEGGFRPGLDLDSEFALQSNAPAEHWFLFSGPDTFIGTPTGSNLVPNLGIVRVGFPSTFSSIFGMAFQVVPRVDLGWFGSDYHHIGEGRRAIGAGVVVRGVLKNLFAELSVGANRINSWDDREASKRGHHISFLLGTRPYDLWRDQ